MLDSLKGKKLLIIGGAFQHCKLVEAAKDLGVITYVTDYLPVEYAPAKLIADKYYMYNITDYDDIVELCKAEKIDGAIATSLDACQKPYQHICELMGYSCFGTKEQYAKLTDKKLFKAACFESGIDVIPEYKERYFENEDTCLNNVEFPVLVKPSESRGSRGQTICYSYEETKTAIDFAKSESSNGEVLIEKYMGQSKDFSMTVLVINGKTYVTRTVDRILGRYEDKLDKLAVGSVSPSVFTDLYMENVHCKIQKFVSDIGLQNAPMFMQGFVDGDIIRFYDPGLRFPGGEHERMFTYACGKNPFYPLIEFALTGKVSEESTNFSDNDVWLNKKIACQVLPSLKPGIIKSVKGLDMIKNHPDVVSVFTRYNEGDEIKPTQNVNQRFCEIDIVSESADKVKDVVRWIYDTLKITDEIGNDMIVSKFDPDCFSNRL